MIHFRNVSNMYVLEELDLENILLELSLYGFIYYL